MGIPVQQVYGITEYIGAVTFWKESQHPEKYDSMGKPVMLAGLKIKDLETNEEVAKGTVGEIVRQDHKFLLAIIKTKNI